ncbi:hypothetical protein DDE82_007138 [Stemphylium lycopersici]|uniref:Uncharacterized protein n=1 Tax=Stemphylium lycopersici TaxID=183478 RepID=A0A364MXK8_STELY|nr:hypothetical protein TW65_05100 [Stemphylium lycopersici]RAR00664.1 hypothetical protein DDE82_007138 [Stemphylium lycopersici]RAR06449.1 hypothetical protein DDE83_006935 [Stemphylium lycopersici]
MTLPKPQNQTMEPHRLKNIFATTLKLLTGILIYFTILPFLLLWRLSLYTLLPFSAHAPALFHYTTTLTILHAHPLFSPLLRYRIRIVSSTLLLAQTIFSLAVLEKALVRFIPWCIAHFRAQHAHSSESEKRAEFLVHLGMLMMSCAPFFSTAGAGVSVLYYARKVWVYGRFEKKMVRLPGGRGYYMPEPATKGEEEGGGERGKKTVAETFASAARYVGEFHVPRLHHQHGQGHQHGSQHGNTPSGTGSDVLFQQPGDGLALRAEPVSAPQAAVVREPEPVARKFDSNPYTLAGVMSIWSRQRDDLKSGYDGRDVRRRNFEEDIEMGEGLGMGRR